MSAAAAPPPTPRRPGRDAPGRPVPGHAGAPIHRRAASPRTCRSTRRSCSTPPDGSRSTSCAASPWCRSPSGCGTGGGAPSRMASDAHNAAVDQAARLLRGRVRQGARARRGRRAGRGGGAHAPHRRRARRHRGAADGRARTPGAADAAQAMPFVSDLSARDFTLLQRAGWMPVGLAFGASFVYAPRRTAGHRHEADDAERRTDQLHRGHVLGPRVGHGEDAALGPRGRAARAWSRSRSPRAR